MPPIRRLLLLSHHHHNLTSGCDKSSSHFFLLFRFRSTATNDGDSLFNRPNHPLSSPRQGLPLLVKDKVNQVMVAYEDFIGIKQVKEAQERVLSAETCFKASQQLRRAAQEKVVQVQNQLRVLRMDIDRTARGDNRYLELIKNEIDIIREERDVRSHFEELEERERELFSELSNALRMSHEKERAQGEKTKYWSIFGSLFGAFLGIVGTTINARMRHKQTKDILLQTSAHVAQIEEAVQNLSLKMGVEPIPLQNTAMSSISENVAKLLKSVKDQEETLRLSFVTLTGVTKTVESVAGQLNQEWADAAARRKPPVYFNLDSITPGDSNSPGHVAVVMSIFMLGAGVIMFVLNRFT